MVEEKNKKLLIISDLHGNYEALKTVLDTRMAREAEEIYCLGDIVGYGASPGKCVEEIRSRGAKVILGNHDALVTGRISFQEVNILAEQAARWTQKQLTDRQIEYLRELPVKLRSGEFMFYHGSPSRPLRQYVETPWDFRRAWSQVHDCLLLGLGHLHKPRLVRGRRGEELQAVKVKYEEPFEFAEDEVGVFNPGSVGQPRDGDSRAACCLAEVVGKNIKLSWQRVEYDVTAAADRIVEAGLPTRLADRLFKGR